MKEKTTHPYRFRIHSQLFLKEQGQFYIYDSEDDSLFRTHVQALFNNKDMLHQFSPDDMGALAFTAGVESVLCGQRIVDEMCSRVSDSSIH